MSFFLSSLELIIKFFKAFTFPLADIVFVNPVNTAYSRMIADDNGEFPDKSQFFGINEDIAYLSGWINTFLSLIHI